VVSATQMVVYVLKGHDFSRAINGAKTSRALQAAEKPFIPVLFFPGGDFFAFSARFSGGFLASFCARKPFFRPPGTLRP